MRRESDFQVNVLPVQLQLTVSLFCRLRDQPQVICARSRARSTPGRRIISLTTRTVVSVCLLFLPTFLGSVGQTSATSPQSDKATTQDNSAGPVTTLHVSSKLVLVDVSVTDSSGHFVRNLKKSDFSVTEDNKPQVIRSFDEHTQAEPGAYPSTPKLPKLGPDVFTNYTPVPPNGTLTILLLDMLNTPYREQSIVRDQVLKFLKEVRPDQRIAIFGLSDHLLLLQGFSSDPELLRKALQASSRGQLSRLLDDSANGTQVASGEEANSDQYSNDPTTQQTLQNLQALETQLVGVQQQVRTEETLDALDLLARYLSGMNGKKNILWYSTAFPTGFSFNDTGEGPAVGLAPDIEALIRRTTNLLATAQTAVFPIDAGGLAVPGDFSVAGSKGPTGQSVANSFQQTATAHNAMIDIAEDTGGHAYFNTNGLAEAATDAIEFGSNFYTLAYVPSNKSTDGYFRHIVVKVSGKKYRLAYRRGYYADKPDQDSAANSAADAVPKAGSFSAALMRGAPNPTEIIFKVRAQPGRDSESEPAPGNDIDAKVAGPFRRYLVDFSADIHNIQTRELPGDLHHVSLEFVTIVYDQDNAMINSMTNTLTGDLPASSYLKAMQTGMKFRQLISIPVKGKDTMRVAVRDILGNHLGTVEVPVSQLVEIPPDPALSEKP